MRGPQQGPVANFNQNPLIEESVFSGIFPPAQPSFLGIPSACFPFISFSTERQDEEGVKLRCWATPKPQTLTW